MTSRKSGRAPRLILDIGGVLVDHDDALLADRLVRLLGDDAARRETILTAFRESGLGAGRCSPVTVYLDLAARLGVFADVASFRRIWSSHFTPKDDMLAFARDYARRAPLVLCSNTDVVHWAFLGEAFGLDTLGTAVLSHEVGLMKPDPEIYLLAAQAHEAPPGECLFVDDRPDYVEGARAVGMKATVFKGVDDLAVALDNFS